ncbi:MAG TPA: hypothetical protein PLJ60_13595 [Chryseolinea sp.]|nr:hypothetical protein [Chryseolinea sp.]
MNIQSFALSLLFIIGTFSLVKAQSNYAPLNEDYYHWIDRYEVKSGRVSSEIFTAVKPYRRSDIVAFVDSLHQGDSNVFTSKTDQFNYDYLRNDSWEWSRAETSDSRKPFLKYLYRKKSDAYHVDVDALDLHINPVIYFGLGKDSRNDDMAFINTRGVELRGMIDKKVGFYTYLTDNQAIVPSYVWDQMSLNPVVPHEGFWKSYKGKTAAVDFLQARGYITFDPTKHINIQFGHDRFFIGNGYRSFIFSDYAPPSLFLKTDVKVWKFNYLFSLNNMTADAPGTLGGSKTSSSGNPMKFVAFHQLSMNIGKKLNIGVFESVVFTDDDSLHTGGFEWSYLNPIIFYRAIEQQNGSSDNVILGMDIKWNLVKKLSLYGQFILDEFKIDEIRAGNGWWANKYAIQFGAKYIDAFGVSNLDLQGEFNLARPFTFAHNTQYGGYVSYNQPIGHPLGANFNEVIGILRYQPLPRLNLVGKLTMTNIGRDSTSNSKNYGSNLLRDNSKDRDEYGNTIGQGYSNKIVFASFTASWQVMQNLFVDANLVVRKSQSDLPIYNSNTTITSLALRWNIARRLYEF